MKFYIYFFLIFPFSLSYSKNIDSLSQNLYEKQNIFNESINNASINSEFTSKNQIQIDNCHNTYVFMDLHYDFHMLTSISPKGKFIVIEDGSCWEVVYYSDQSKVLKWKTTDTLFIYNKGWDNDFKMENKNLNDSINIKLLHGPFFEATFSKQIIYIDIEKLEIALSDQSLWKISSSDKKILKDWYVDDYIVIGNNKSSYKEKYTARE